MSESQLKDRIKLLSDAIIALEAVIAIDAPETLLAWSLISLKAKLASASRQLADITN